MSGTRMTIGECATAATPDVILGLGPRTQRSASPAGQKCLLCQLHRREMHPAPTCLSPTSAYVEPWVLGTSPRMTQRGADEPDLAARGAPGEKAL